MEDYVVAILRARIEEIKEQLGRHSIDLKRAKWSVTSLEQVMSEKLERIKQIELALRKIKGNEEVLYRRFD